MANEIESSRSLLQSVADNSAGPDEDDILTYYEPRVLKHGMAAWQLAADLRRENKLKPYESEFDTFGWMKQRAETLKQKQDEHDKRVLESQRKMTELMNAGDKPAALPTAS